ncbi:hypothetical protein D3C74_371660 [compost metagenome]
MALPTLSAEWHSAAPSEGASGERSMRRVWSASPRIWEVTPSRNSAATAGTGLWPVSANATRAAAVDPNPIQTVRMTSLSASLPPTTVPSVMPRPKIARTTGTTPSESPVTSVMVGAT